MGLILLLLFSFFNYITPNWNQDSENWFKLTSNNLLREACIQDTLLVDERIETPQMYVYHEYNIDDNFKFNETNSSNQTLKLVKNKKPFSGMLILENENRRKFCPYINGIPDGVWLEYAQDGRIKYEIPIKNGFYNGVGKFYNDDGSLYKIGKFTNGYPDGLFVDFIKYLNTGEIYESERLILKTLFYKPTLANLPYLMCKTKEDNRLSVQGVYVSEFYHANFLPTLTPSNDNYWLHIIGCLNTINNPLPISQTILDGEYVKKDLFLLINEPEYDGNSFIKIKEKIFWKDGKCLWSENYGDSDQYSGSSFNKYLLSTKSVYEYYKGYYLETRTSQNISYTDYSDENIYQQETNVQDLTFFDTLATNTITYINGHFKQGKVREFTYGGTSQSLSGLEGKFSVNYNYSEGEYYLNTKIGEWKYFIITRHENKLVCVCHYKPFSNTKFKGFNIKMPFTNLCSSYDADQEVKNGEERFYRLNDGKLFIGYIYRNGEAISVIKY